MTYEIKAACPECGMEVDGARAIGDDLESTPEAGDIAICIYCAEVAVYELAQDGTLCLRRVTLEERLMLSDDEDVMAVREKIFAMLGGGPE